MTEQEENELICEKLLGWHKCLPDSKGARNGYCWQESEGTPSFTTWAEGGLILDAVVAGGGYYNLGMGGDREMREGPWVKLLVANAGGWARNGGRGDTMPLAIRAAALDAIASHTVSH